MHGVLLLPDADGGFMTGAVGTYLLSVAAAALFAALTQSLLPKGGVRRVAGFVGGLVLILAVVSPLAGLEYADLARSMAQIRIETEQMQTGVHTGNREILSEIIKQRCEAYILEKARNLGLSLEVTVTLEEDGTYPYPAGVILKGSFSQTQRAALTAEISQNLAIPARQQEWIAIE